MTHTKTKSVRNKAYESFMNAPSIQPSYFDPAKQMVKSRYDKVIKTKPHLAEGIEPVPFDEIVQKPKWVDHWKGMPDFNNEAGLPFDEQSDVDEEDPDVDEKAKKNARKANLPLRWMDDNRTLPRYPVYIISKNRSQYMKTSRSLTQIRMPHYIAVEPQDMQPYTEALIKFGLNEYATLLELPFSNHGEGPGRARNWCWDHSVNNGFERHWVFDDNITDFYRLHNNVRARVDSGAIFRAAEDFVDRYENLPLASFGYRFDYAPKENWAPIRIVRRHIKWDIRAA